MKQELPLKDEFIHWLEYDSINDKGKNISRDSAKSYVSYVTSVNNHLEWERKLFDRIEQLLENKEYGTIISLLDTALSEINTPGFDAKHQKAPKTISNWKSGLIGYIGFFENMTDNEGYCEDRNPPSSSEKGLLHDLALSYTDVKKRFVFRMVTQDRFYGEIYYPIGLLKRLFAQSAESMFFKKMIDEQIDNIIIHLPNASTIPFKNIVKINIQIEGEEQGLYIVDKKGSKQPIYTPDAEEKKTYRFDKPHLDLIAIDHVIPMKEIMIKHKESLPGFRKLTKAFQKAAGSHAKPSDYKASITKVLESYDCSAEEMNQLKAELELIHREIKLQLMDKKENGKKSAKIN